MVVIYLKAEYLTFDFHFIFPIHDNVENTLIEIILVMQVSVMHRKMTLELNN
jgi:hypothetical protein